MDLCSSVMRLNGSWTYILISYKHETKVAARRGRGVPQINPPTDKHGLTLFYQQEFIQDDTDTHALRLRWPAG